MLKATALAVLIGLSAGSAMAETKVLNLDKGLRASTAANVMIAEKVHLRTPNEALRLAPAVAQAEFLRIMLFGQRELCEFQAQIGCRCFLDGHQTLCSIVATCLQVGLCELE